MILEDAAGRCGRLPCFIQQLIRGTYAEGNAELVEQPSKKQKTEAAAHDAVEVDAVNGKAAPSDAPQSAIANGRAARSAGWKTFHVGMTVYR